jgi:hypothetical protein
MSQPDITIKPQELAQKFIEMSNGEIRLAAARLSAEQLSAVIMHLNKENTPLWKEKTRAVISGLSEREQLELAGSCLSVPQLLDIFENHELTQDDNFNKLLAILVGVNHQHFSQLLSEISDEQLQVLLQTSFSEPLQHHLTVFEHEMNIRYQMMADELKQLFIQIESLSIQQIGRKELIELKNKINDLSLEINQGLEKMKNALRIAWNTHRSDLIESLNAIKEKYFHTLNNFIGHPETGQGATGLYELLNIRLNAAFGNPEDLNDPETLSDEEPALEALVKFSIWYLKDYWEVGLLPNIQSENELELDPQTSSEESRLEYRDKLFSTVRENLEKLHLKTLHDLKKAHIYSKKALIDYIQERSLYKKG